MSISRHAEHLLFTVIPQLTPIWEGGREGSQWAASTDNGRRFRPPHDIQTVLDMMEIDIINTDER